MAPRVVVFDLDGTLLRGTTVSLLLAEWRGKRAEIEVLEERFRRHEISNAVVADASAGWLEGVALDDVGKQLERAPWIAGIPETLRALRSAGSHTLVATVTWSFAAEWLVRRHGFAACCGTGMEASGGVVSGRVARYFDEHDKAAFVAAWCAKRSIPLGDVAAVGDSRSDVPLFRRVGFSIALNATQDARDAATVALDADDLRAILPLLDR